MKPFLIGFWLIDADMGSRYSDVARRMARGAVWTVLMRFAVRSIGIVSTIILARLLVPEDFGLVALATTLVALLELVNGLNFSAYLIREQATERSHYDTAWTLSVIRGVMTGGALALSAPFAAEFFREPRLETVVYALSVGCALVNCANIGIVDFQKTLSFDADFRFMVRTKLVAFAITVTLAYLMRNYWALVIGMMSRQLATVLFSYTMHPFRPRPSLARTGEIIRFSKWLLVNNLLNFAARRCDVAIIGRFLDSGSLGLYAIAREIAAMTKSELVVPIGRVLFPGFSKLSDDPAAVRRAFLDGLSVIAMLGLPLAAGMGLIADPLVRLALGENWIGAIPVLQILALASLMAVCKASSDPFYMATNRPYLTTVTACSGAIVGVTSALWGASGWGLSGVAWAMSGTAAFQTLLNYMILWRSYGIAPGPVLRAIWRSVLSCAVMAGVIWELSRIWPRPDSFTELLIELLVLCACGAIVYIATQLSSWRLAGAPDGAERRILALIGTAVSRFRPRRALEGA